ncbi:MAG: type VI secretion system baseplate subunit TssF, partial [Nitrospinae bacterium]|nr:type VI secretion system baseplate subunit TssF [Nitrospinota bacterium]
MLNRYYEQELAGLKDLAVEFSRAHPTLAPLLGGASTDPDVERLLEGVAFLSGQIRQKLEDEFPEVVQTLAQLFFPHYLRPIPCASVVAFSPKMKLDASLAVAAGTELASVPVDGVRCRFRTCFPTRVDPIRLTGARLDQSPGQPAAVELGFTLEGVDLVTFAPTDLRLFLSGGYADATRLYYLLQRFVKRIVVATDGGSPFVLSPAAVRPVGFASGEELIPYPSQSYPGYRILQEYLALPEKFLFLDLTGLAEWEGRGNGGRFTVRFELAEVPDWTPPVRPDQFTLHATPVVNLFTTDATPISLDHRKTEYPVRASGAGPSRYPVYTVDRVIGFRQGSAGQRDYVPFEMFRGGAVGAKGGAYQTRVRPARIGAGIEVFLAVAYGADEPLGVPETLSLSVTVTDGSAPESLRLGDINAATD